MVDDEVRRFWKDYLENLYNIDNQEQTAKQEDGSRGESGKA